MLRTPMDVLAQFPVRKSRKQKESFRSAVRSYGEQLGYTVTEEKGSFGSRNLLLGDPETAKYLITAHYDTCARMLLPNFITPCNSWIYLAYQFFIVFLLVFISGACGCLGGLLLGESAVKRIGLFVYFLLLLLLCFGPGNRNNANDNTSGVVTLLETAKTLPEKQRHKVCFVLFDLEEAGLIGSASYRKKHKKATENQLVLNLDCIGDGENLRMFPTRKLRRDKKKLTSLYKACGYFGSRSLLVYEGRTSVYPSDQKRFPYGVGICALRKKRKILYMSRIHTDKDTVLEITNVNILRAALTTFICCDEVN